MESEVERSSPCMIQPLTASCIFPRSLAIIMLPFHCLRNTPKMASTSGPASRPTLLPVSLSLSHLILGLSSRITSSQSPTWAFQTPYMEHVCHIAIVLLHRLCGIHLTTIGHVREQNLPTASMVLGKYALSKWLHPGNLLNSKVAGCASYSSSYNYIKMQTHLKV